MKILKILIIILVPAIGIVGCQKSNVHPKCQNNTSSTKAKSTSEASRFNSNTDDDNYNPQSTDVVGSGDDDRDGGDKPKKNGVK